MKHSFQSRLLGLSRVGLVVGLISCASPGNPGHRTPASNLPPAFQEGLIPSAQKILATINAPDFGAHCVPYLKELQTNVEAIKPSEGPEADLVGHASDLIGLLWNIRVALHKGLPGYSAECVVEIRNTARLLRFIEDFLAEHAGHITGEDPDKMDFSKQDTPVLANDPYYLRLDNADFPGFEFKNGDLMIARGTSFMSAIISRVGDISSQFSHVIMVHVDKDTHKVETIESYVGLGVGIYDLDTALKNENVRLLLLRPKDQDLASKAADFMYAKAKAAIAAGHPIPYDYKFDFKDHAAVSCAEVAEWAFEAGSDGKVIVPFYPSTISESPSFLKRVGMSPGETFTPGDLEVDPRFDLVMEWRDLRLTRDSRVKDSILTSMLGWIDTKGYVLHDTGTSKFAGIFIWRARKTFAWPLIQKIFKIEDFSKDVPQNLFQTVVLLNQIGSVFLNEMNLEDQNFEKSTGWAMTYQDLYDGLESYRQTDLGLYLNKKTRKRAQFTFAFKPPKQADQ
jgi:hypothetical protein